MNQPHLTPGQLDDRDRRRFRTFNGPQRDPSLAGKASGTPYFRRGHGRILGPDDFMPVGEHAGKHLRAVPPEFLLWVDQQPWSKHWAPWEAVHSYIERYILPDPETASAIALPVGPIIFVTEAGLLHTLPGFEDMLHAFAVGASNFKTLLYQSKSIPPHYPLPPSKQTLSLRHGATQIDRATFHQHKTQWQTHFQTRRAFVPENAPTVPTAD